VTWTLRPGCGHDIDVGADGTPWVVGCIPVNGGFEIYQWKFGIGWVQDPGGAVSIAGATFYSSLNGGPPVLVPAAWVTNDVGQIWNDVSGPSWQLVPGCGHDIAVADGYEGVAESVWVVGCNPVPGGYGIYRQNSTGLGWEQFPGGAVSISVDPSGSPWVTNNSGQIYHWNGSTWVHVPGCGEDIGVGFFGSVWVVGCNPVPGGYGVYRWNGTGWTPEPGGAVSIGVDTGGGAWVTNSVGQIYSSS
jgi:hypothetical protein